MLTEFLLVRALPCKLYIYDKRGVVGITDNAISCTLYVVFTASLSSVFCGSATRDISYQRACRVHVQALPYRYVTVLE